MLSSPIVRVFALSVLLALVAPLPSLAATVFVDADATGTNDGTSWADAYVELHTALSTAVFGDEIWVAAGTYSPDSAAGPSGTLLLRSGIALLGGFAGDEASVVSRDWEANKTILSGVLASGPPEVRCYHVVTGSGADATAILDGFTIRGGYAKGQGVDGRGGGILNVNGSPTVRNAVITENVAREGCGVANLEASNPTYTDVLIADNDHEGSGLGAGMYNSASSPVLRRVTIRDNGVADSGEGMANVDGSAPLIEDSIIAPGLDGGGTVGVSVLNNASSPTFRDVTIYGDLSFYGSCMANVNGSDVLIERVEFIGGNADDGAGQMYNNNSEVTMRDVVFRRGQTHSALYGGGAIGNFGGRVSISGGQFLNCGSQALDGGGAIYNRGTELLLVNVLFANNETAYTGSSLANDGGAVSLVNCTAVGNRTWSISLDGASTISSRGGSLTASNLILWDNVVPVGSEHIFVDDATVQLDHSILEGSGGSGPSWNPLYGIDGGGNLDIDAVFVDANNGDYRLQATSPAIDAGRLLALPSEVMTDLDGLPRVSGLGVDMGAYEYPAVPCERFDVAFGASWDGVSLQEILDDEFGPGAIDVATDYEGARWCDATTPYWLDEAVDAWIVREIAGSARLNLLGWYAEDFAIPLIDGLDDGVIFDGDDGAGTVRFVDFGGNRRFGLYLNPNGMQDAVNAPEPELFFTNRSYNDVGPEGSGALHPPLTGGDPQALIYNVSHLRGGVPTYVVAWEDIDSGSPLSATWRPGYSDNDYNDLVIEVRANSPVSVAMVEVLGLNVRADGVHLSWTLQGVQGAVRFAVQRRAMGEDFVEIAILDAADVVAEFVDSSIEKPSTYTYRVVALIGGSRITSGEQSIEVATPVLRKTHLVRARPNPFNPVTTIEYELARKDRVELRIYDLAGRLLRTIHEGERDAGLHDVKWNGQDDSERPVASGVYLVLLMTTGEHDALRVVLLK